MNDFEPCPQCGENAWKLKFEANYFPSRNPLLSEYGNPNADWGIAYYECKNCRYVNASNCGNAQ